MHAYRFDTHAKVNGNFLVFELPFFDCLPLFCQLSLRIDASFIISENHQLL